jgi:pimeloyl-ACP methyl ester carboxylesterase
MTHLAARQAELVAALVADGPVPPGFDPDQLAVARRALERKRAGEAAAVWPLLAGSLGPTWPDAYAASVGGRGSTGALRDGWNLARELSRRGELGDAAALELAEREVALRYRDGRPRRLPAVRRYPGGAVVQLGGRVHHLALR